jgi:hypothetical protein
MGSRCKLPGPTTASKGDVTCKKCLALMDRDRRREVDIPEGKKLRVTMGMVRQLIREADFVEKPTAELERIIAAMQPDEESQEDYVDIDTGEIVLEKGKKARTSPFHPQYTIDHQEHRKADAAAWVAQKAQWAKEDEEWEAEKERSRNEAQVAFDAAIREYAGNWTDWRQSMGHEEDYGTDEQSVAMDAAAGFFHQFPEWKRWAVELGMKKEDIQSAVADFVYEAIITGRVDF